MFWTKYSIKSLVSDVDFTSELKLPLIRQKMTVADGFSTDKEALDFGNNSCGAACLKTVLEAFEVKSVPAVKLLTETAIKKGYYREPQGWLHKGIADFAKSYELKAKTFHFEDARRMLEVLKQGKLIIASVSNEFNSKKRGGHLVVIKGLKIQNGDLKMVYFNDPSAYGQEHSDIDGESFLRSWTGNVIIIWK